MKRRDLLLGTFGAVATAALAPIRRWVAPVPEKTKDELIAEFLGTEEGKRRLGESMVSPLRCGGKDYSESRRLVEEIKEDIRLCRTPQLTITKESPLAVGILVYGKMWDRRKWAHATVRPDILSTDVSNGVPELLGGIQKLQFWSDGSVTGVRHTVEDGTHQVEDHQIALVVGRFEVGHFANRLLKPLASSHPKFRLEQKARDEDYRMAVEPGFKLRFYSTNS